jgi:predicted nucleotidyltransferase component of viral defense system
MKPKLEILPKAQLELWPKLATVPNHFVLYGGTAIALQLGHRQSIDFDFFSSKPLNRNELIQALPFLTQSKLVQPEINTLDCFYETEYGSIKLQFLAGIDERQGRMENPHRCIDNGLLVASLRDLIATKLNTIQARAEMKDYIDIDAILKTDISLSEGLACAVAIFGQAYDPETSIRALCSYRDGDLAQLPEKIKNRLTQIALDIKSIPKLKPLGNSISSNI